MKTIKIIDFYSINNFHEIVNFSLLQCFSNIYSNVVYIVGKSAFLNLQKLSKQNDTEFNNVIFKPKWVIELTTPLGALLRMLLGFFFLMKEYFTLKKSETIYCNYNNPIALPILALFNRFYKKNVIIILHGELELFFKSVPLYKANYIYKRLNYISLKFLIKPSKIKLILLGDSIKDNLLKLFPDLSENIIAINHPYIFKEKKTFTAPKVNNLTLGVVGHLIPEKGLYELIKLSEILKDKVFSNELTIKVIGKVPSYIDKSKYKGITWLKYDYIPRNIFEEEINTLDYILFLYPKDSYKLTASGALLDAISNTIPIIALNNSYFSDVLKGYEIGYICESFDEIIATINTLLNTNVNYDIFIRYIEAIKRKFTIEFNTKLLKEQLP